MEKFTNSMKRGTPPQGREVKTPHPNTYAQVNMDAIDGQLAKRLRAVEKKLASEAQDPITVVIVPGSKKMIELIHSAFEGTVNPQFIECDAVNAWKYIESGEADLVCIDLSDKITTDTGIVSRLKNSIEAQPVTVVFFGSELDQANFRWFDRSIFCGWDCQPAKLLVSIASHVPLMAHG